jgi:hypothetical protein
VSHAALVGCVHTVLDTCILRDTRMGQFNHETVCIVSVIEHEIVCVVKHELFRETHVAPLTL